jgi:4'-phosphopantetheinyl transferase
MKLELQQELQCNLAGGDDELKMQNRSVYIDELDAIRSENIFKATLCCCFISGKADYEEIIRHLHPQERNYYDTLAFEKRIRSYLLGRLVAKQAVSALTGENFLNNINIQYGIFKQPIVVFTKQNIQVSITHCDDFGAALAFPEAHPMGIDIEKINPHTADVLKSQITEAEEELIHSSVLSYELGHTLLWTAKEALSKVLKTGLMTPFEVFEIVKIELHDHYILCYYKNFAQYKVISFTIANYMCSIAHPLKSKLSFDVQSLKANFTFIKS